MGCPKCFPLGYPDNQQIENMSREKKFNFRLKQKDREHGQQPLFQMKNKRQTHVLHELMWKSRKEADPLGKARPQSFL